MAVTMNTQVLLHMMLCRLVVTDVSERQAQENKHLVLFKCHYNVWYIYIYIYIYIYVCVCILFYVVGSKYFDFCATRVSKNFQQIFLKVMIPVSLMITCSLYTL